jgi:hypothetical protein
MNDKQKVVFGIILTMASLWIGAYALRAIGSFHWAYIPTFITTSILIATGFMMALFYSKIL